jgi:ADP-heptose:LPS heptosyltransferase
LCWRGNPNYAGDRTRSMRLQQLEPLLKLPGIRFVSLQKELRADERAPDLVHPGADFAGTAALVAALDLVIAVDTVWAHWAGAIGKPVWLLLARIPHWCWMMEREDSPWYPSARLFRQPQAGDWRPAVDKLARELGRRF